MEADNLWNQVLDELALKMTSGNFRANLDGTMGLRIDDEQDPPVIYVGVPDPLMMERLNARLRVMIGRVLSRVTGGMVPVFELMTGQDDAALMDKDDADMPVMVELMGYDPQDSGYVLISNYAIRYWQPYLGRGPFALWLLLRSYAWSCMRTKRWPSVGTLAGILGADRHTITGRDRPEGRQPGYIDSLQYEKIIKVEYRRSRYVYTVRDKLPLLMPAQAEKLPQLLRDSHVKWLEKNGVNVATWRTLSSETLCK